MAAQDITAILEATYTPNGQQAEQQLKEFEKSDFPSYFLSLSAELGNEGKQEFTRRLAGLLLKNALDSKDDIESVSCPAPRESPPARPRRRCQLQCEWARRPSAGAWGACPMMQMICATYRVICALYRKIGHARPPRYGGRARTPPNTIRGPSILGAAGSRRFPGNCAIF